MYNYEWDEDTGGYLLNTKITGVIKEVRPVFHEELRLLGFDKKFGWIIPESNEPLMWAEGRRYFYRGELAGEANGGGLYELPSLVSHINGLNIRPVNIEKMVQKNKVILNGLVQKTLNYIYETYKEYSEKRVDIIYVAFSGGKDSLVLLDLVQRALPHDAFKVIFADTTMELPDTLKAVEISKKRWSNLDWHIAKSHMDASETWEKMGYPARKLKWCCSVHKTAPSILKLKELYNEKSDKSKPFKIMVFDGVRAEESDSRALYSMISEGNKHTTQINCSSILEWNTSELFVYMFEHDLFINNLYRSGVTRVGCKLCPMASNWNECMLNHTYAKDLEKLLGILYSSIKKDFSNEVNKKRYLQDGGWKSRIGGRELIIGENKIIEISSPSEIKFIINNANYKWDKWIKTIGDLIEISDGNYLLVYEEVQLNFNVNIGEEKNSITISFVPLIKSKSTIRFMHLLKHALYKSAYCVNCKVCMAECAFNALFISSHNIEIKECTHCASCLDIQQGCIVAHSIGITGGGKNMSDKNINRYQNFGFRQDWLKLYFELQDNFWKNEQLGKYMFVSARTWFKEAEITLNNAISELGTTLCNIGSEADFTWAVVYINLAYNSPIFNWYIKKVNFYDKTTIEDIALLLGDNFSETTKKNALSSLKETLKTSPIGVDLGQGDCEMKGKTVVAVTRGTWQSPEPLAILYSLYKFAEKSDMYYNFTLSDLLDDSDERIGLSPNILFGIDKAALKPMLQGLAHDYTDYIKVTFNKDLENININKEKTSIDIVKLY